MRQVGLFQYGRSALMDFKVLEGTVVSVAYHVNGQAKQYLSVLVFLRIILINRPFTNWFILATDEKRHEITQNTDGALIKVVCVTLLLLQSLVVRLKRRILFCLRFFPRSCHNWKICYTYK